MKPIALFFLLAATPSLRADLTLVQKVDMAGTPGEMTTAQPSALANSGTNIPDFRDLPGVPVKIEMDTVRGHVVMTLVSVKRDLIPSSEFSVPADYTEMKMPDIFGGKNAPDNPAEKVPASPRVVPMPSPTP